MRITANQLQKMAENLGYNLGIKASDGNNKPAKYLFYRVSGGYCSESPDYIALGIREAIAWYYGYLTGIQKV
jgi:hypothetical protein